MSSIASPHSNTMEENIDDDEKESSPTFASPSTPPPSPPRSHSDLDSDVEIFERDVDIEEQLSIRNSLLSAHSSTTEENMDDEKKKGDDEE